MGKHALAIDEPRVLRAERVDDAPLSARRAFVVQFRERTGKAPERFAGRVEHMVSGQAAHFRSAQELTRFMREVLRALDPERESASAGTKPDGGRGGPALIGQSPRLPLKKSKHVHQKELSKC
jgi:hypothetical protein